MYCLSLKVALMAWTVALSHFTNCLRVKGFHDCQKAYKNFRRQICLEYGNILIYCHPQDTTTKYGEQTMVPYLGVNRYLICIHTK